MPGSSSPWERPAARLASIVLAWLMAGSASGQLVPLEAEFRVNSYTTDLQISSHVAAIGGGNFVVAWSSSDGRDGDTYGIFARRLIGAPDSLNLLRSDALVSLSPVTPDLASIFVGNTCATPRTTNTSLDPEGSDCLPEDGEGGMLSAPGTADGDHLYRDGALIEDEPGVLADDARPLVLYQIEAIPELDATILLVKDAASASGIVVDYTLF